MKKLARYILLFIYIPAFSQQDYRDSLENYLADYVQKHEVVTGDDKLYFKFFPVNEKYRVAARFEKVNDGKWFQMETSGAVKKTFKVYGILHFTINDTAVSLHVYQSQNLMNLQEYKDYLFLPFTDLSSGGETYSSGRYIDLNIPDISGDKVIIDFNKAYNPYCVYVSGKYNCPIPPKENQLMVAILAGEKNFEKGDK